MDLARQRTRLLWMGLLLVLAFLALGYRLVDLQVIQHETLLERANRSHALQITTKGHRGDLRDSRGEVLARSLPAKAICADPSLIGEHYTAVARALAPLLRTNEWMLAETLQPRRRTNRLGEVVLDRKGRPVTNQYVVLRRRVLDEEWKAISSVLEKETFGLPTNRVREISALRKSIRPSRDEDEIRVYPNRALASTVIGFTDGVGGGVEGLEAFLNEQLKGVDGFIKTERSRRGGELRRFREIQMPPQNGRDVYVTIDARLQLIVEEELAATLRQFQAAGGCVVVVQPRTGRILAMASLPNFDPNRPPVRPQDAVLRRNWGVSYTFEPGSTFKLVAATAVMNEGLMELTDRVDCGEHGQYVGEFGRERVRLSDVHVIKDRYATVERVIAESSNIGTFQLALKLGRPPVRGVPRTIWFWAEDGHSDAAGGARSGAPDQGLVDDRFFAHCHGVHGGGHAAPIGDGHERAGQRRTSDATADHRPDHCGRRNFAGSAGAGSGAGDLPAGDRRQGASRVAPGGRRWHGFAG
jgi:cell division protein FtsI (penicillin-binding protein 3)